MIENGFHKGELAYTTASGVTPEGVAHLLKGWRDGYVAFANGELRLGDLGLPLDERLLANRLQDIRKVENIEGYVTELNLWRSEGTVLEEIAIEREENSFLVQTFRLDTAPAQGGNCWYRPAATRAGSHHKNGRRIFSGDLATIEVVWPEKRLNLFITRGK